MNVHQHTNTNVHRVKFFEPTVQAIRCLAYDKFSRRLAVSRSDSSIEIWDTTENPHLEKVIPGVPTTSVEVVTWCKGRLFSAGLFGFITEYDFDTLKAKYRLCVTSGSAIWCMSFDKEEKYLAAGNEDGHITFHQLSSEGLDFVKKSNKQQGAILCLAWHRDGRVIVTGSKDIIRVFSVETGHVLNTIKLSPAAKFSAFVWSIAVTSDMTIISGDSRGRTSFWDGNTCTLLSEQNCEDKDILALSLNEEENCLYASGVDRFIQIFEKSNNQWVKSVKRFVHTHDVRALQCVGDALISGGDDCNLVFTNNWGSSTTITCFPFCQKSYATVNSNPSCILLRYPDYIEIWSLRNPSNATEKYNGTDYNFVPSNLLRVRPKTNERVISASVSSDGTWLAYSTQERLRLFRIKLDSKQSSLEKVLLPEELRAAARIVVFTSNSNKMICYSKGKIFIISCDNLHQSPEYIDCNEGIQLMEVSPNDEYLACGFSNGQTIIYSLNPLKIHFNLPHYQYQPTAMKFDKHSKNLVVAYVDRKIVEFSLETSGYSLFSKYLPESFQSASNHPINSICFCAGKLFVQDEKTIYQFDKERLERTLEQEQDRAVEGVERKVFEGEMNSTVARVWHDKGNYQFDKEEKLEVNLEIVKQEVVDEEGVEEEMNSTVAQFDKEERLEGVKQGVDDEEMSMVKRRKLDLKKITYKTITKFEHISSMHALSDELVVVEMPAGRIIESLPPPVWKKKFGT